MWRYETVTNFFSIRTFILDVQTHTYQTKKNLMFEWDLACLTFECNVLTFKCLLHDIFNLPQKILLSERNKSHKTLNRHKKYFLLRLHSRPSQITFYNNLLVMVMWQLKTVTKNFLWWFFYFLWYFQPSQKIILL